MKKFLGIVFLSIMFFTPSFSQIIELGKCYGVDTYDDEMVRSSWNADDFQKLSLFYFKSYDEPRYNKKYSSWELQTVENYVTDDDYIKDLLSDGYEPINRYKKFILSMNLSNETITVLKVYSAEILDIHIEKRIRLINLKKKYPDKWSNGNQTSLDWLYEAGITESKIDKYKIEDYAGGIFIGRSIEDNGKAIRLDLDTGSYKVGRYKNINKKTFPDTYYKCTKDYKNIVFDVESKKTTAPKNTGSLLKSILKFIN